MGLFHIGEKRKIFFEKTRISEKEVDGWLQKTFHPTLGWDLDSTERNNLSARRIHDYPPKSQYKIKLFGDSFTMSWGVSADKAFSSVIEQKTNWDCLNFGVGAHGPDQAFLKYQIHDIHTEYTVLGILCENIGRVVSHYPAFYMNAWVPPKPRFKIDQDKIHLINTPIQHPEQAHQLFHPSFVEKLKIHDYWPNYYQNELGAPGTLKWPATFTLAKHLPFFLNGFKLMIQNHSHFEQELQLRKYTHLYDPNSEAFKLLQHIVTQFAQLAQQRNEKFIVVIFADLFSLDLLKKYQKKTYSPLTNFLHSHQYVFLDLGPIFVKQDYPLYFDAHTRHHSIKGNQQVAAELIDFINKLEN